MKQPFIVIKSVEDALLKALTKTFEEKNKLVQAISAFCYSHIWIVGIGKNILFIYMP